jgi:predicted RNase H-like nuclease
VLLKMPASRYLGIDGCPGGWFCVGLDADANWSVSVIATDALASVATAATAVLIDIPIGLPDTNVEERLCDREARRELGRGRGSSVFPVPARASLRARDFAEALAINRQCTGRGISKQSWLIAPKIRAVDDLLQADCRLRGVLRESHPEICFWALNDAKAMRHNKKTQEGRDERMALLLKSFPAADSLLEEAMTRYRRKEVARDDIFDALVLAVSARLGAGCYRSLPADPVRDAAGLAMEMVFYAP